MVMSVCLKVGHGVKEEEVEEEEEEEEEGYDTPHWAMTLPESHPHLHFHSLTHLTPVLQCSSR